MKREKAEQQRAVVDLAGLLSQYYSNELEAMARMVMGQLERARVELVMCGGKVVLRAGDHVVTIIDPPAENTEALVALHQDQPCAVCADVPGNQAGEQMGAVEPDKGWAGEPVPICDQCQNDPTETAYEQARHIGKRRFWVGSRLLAVCRDGGADMWSEGDSVAVLPDHGEPTWWHGARYGTVTATGEDDDGTSWVEVEHDDQEQPERYDPRRLVEKTNPYTDQ